MTSNLLTTTPPRIAPDRGADPRGRGSKTRGGGAVREDVPVAIAGESRVKYLIFQVEFQSVFVFVLLFCLDKGTLRLLALNAQDMVLEAGRWTQSLMPSTSMFRTTKSIITVVSLTFIVPHRYFLRLGAILL